MKSRAVPASWLFREGRRLDAKPFLSGAIETRMLIERAKLTREPLQSLTTGYKGGLFTHQFSPKRTYVLDHRYGVPMLGASSMMLSDLSGLPLMSNRNAQSRSYRNLFIRHGMTLTSSSGIVGRVVYARPDMDGMISTGDTLKIQPDPSRIPPGYLFAFLSSRYGFPLLAHGTYGAIIQHIEPGHIADLPVPRVGKAVEEKAHELVQRAALARSRAVQLVRTAHDSVTGLLGGDRADWKQWKLWTEVVASNLVTRCDAYYFSERCLAARESFDSARGCSLRSLDSVAEVFIPGIFKRRYADDPTFGHPYITGADVFQIAPTTDQFLLRQVADEYRLLVRKGMILIQEAGQLGGLIGRSVVVGRYLDGFAVTNNMIRVIPDEDEVGYLFAVLSSGPGTTLISREAAGSSIPHIEAGRVRRIKIPWADTAVRRRIGRYVTEATDLRDEACDSESEARTIVERAIEEAG